VLADLAVLAGLLQVPVLTLLPVLEVVAYALTLDRLRVEEQDDHC